MGEGGSLGVPDAALEISWVNRRRSHGTCCRHPNLMSYRPPGLAAAALTCTPRRGAACGPSRASRRPWPWPWPWSWREARRCSPPGDGSARPWACASPPPRAFPPSRPPAVRAQPPASVSHCVCCVLCSYVGEGRGRLFSCVLEGGGGLFPVKYALCGSARPRKGGEGGLPWRRAFCPPLPAP